VVSPRANIALVLTLLLVSLFAGCGGGSSSPSTPSPTETGTVRLVAPAGCAGSPCVGTTIDGIQISGPESFTAFSISFGRTSILPHAAPGSYTLSDASFTDSTGGTTGCPGAGFTVASGRTTTVTFAITNDVCTIAIAGPV
jgi:hypothetical protein